ncbi:MAG: hypothetical protein AAFO89_14820 [Planctomycetota bacterium]
MKLFGNREGETGRGVSRLQSALLPAVLMLLAVDVFVRLTPPPVQAAEASAQPEGPGGVPTLVNPARQRAMIVDELKEMNRRITSMERKLDGRLRVEVVNFPKAGEGSGND